MESVIFLLLTLFCSLLIFFLLGTPVMESLSLVITALCLNIWVPASFVFALFPWALLSFCLLFIGGRITLFHTGLQWGLKTMCIVLAQAIPAFCIPLMVLWGIYNGMLTPTEAIIIAILYAIIMEGLVHVFKLKALYDTFTETILITILLLCCPFWFTIVLLSSGVFVQTSFLRGRCSLDRVSQNASSSLLVAR